MLNHIKCLQGFLASVLTLALVSQAQAETQTVSASTGLLTAPWNNVTLYLHQFDPALGTLDSIQYLVNGVLQAEVTLRNNSGYTDYTSLNASATLSVSLPGAPFAPEVFPSGFSSLPIFPHSSSTLYAGGSDQTTGTLTGIAMQAYVGKGYVSLLASSSSVSTYVSASSSAVLFLSKETELNVSVTYVYHLNTATVSGTVKLDGIADMSATRVPLDPINIEFRTPGTGTVIVSQKAMLTTTSGSPNGAFTLNGVRVGVYDIAIKSPKNLQVVLPSINVTGALTLPGVVLVGGDSDNNNTADMADFNLLVRAYGAFYDPTNAHSTYDTRAEFDDDGVVDIKDLGILVNNFGASGHP